MMKLLLPLLLILSFWTASALPVNTVEHVKEFFPTGKYRKTGGSKSCLDGSLAWVDGNVIKFGVGAHPVLLHSFGGTYRIPASPQDPKSCTTSTETTAKQDDSAKKEVFKIVEKITQKCAAKTRVITHELIGTKHHKKIELKLSSSDTVKGGKRSVCAYEKNL